MATPGELVRVVADALGIPKATVVQHDRILADAGLRTKAGRGRSAARVTSEDAANLLIAICGAPISGSSLTETVTTCNRYGPLQAYGSSAKLANFSNVKGQLPTLGRLPRGHSFKEAIAALIDSIAAGEFSFAGRLHGNIYINFGAPVPSGSISIEVRRAVRLSYRAHSPLIESERTDLFQERFFSIVSLSKIARVVGSKKLSSDGVS